jgi:hypothetical protein
MQGRQALRQLRNSPSIRILSFHTFHVQLASQQLYFAATPRIRYLENSLKPHLLRTTSRDCKLRPVTTIHLTITTSAQISGRRGKSAAQQFTAGYE